MVRKIFSIILFSFFSFSTFAEDKIELRTTTIKGNKELPKILYVVPWKDIKQSKKTERKLVLHSLFGDFFDPVIPEQHINIEK